MRLEFCVSKAIGPVSLDGAQILNSKYSQHLYKYIEDLFVNNVHFCFLLWEILSLPNNISFNSWQSNLCVNLIENLNVLEQQHAT